MAAHQLKRNARHSPDATYGELERDAGRARVAAGRFDPELALTQFHFAAPAAERGRAVAVLAVAAIAVIGAVAGIAYFAGLVAAVVAGAAIVALAGFGTWVLNNTIDL